MSIHCSRTKVGKVLNGSILGEGYEDAELELTFVLCLALSFTTVMLEEYNYGLYSLNSFLDIGDLSGYLEISTDCLAYRDVRDQILHIETESETQCKKSQFLILRLRVFKLVSNIETDTETFNIEQKFLTLYDPEHTFQHIN